MYEIPIRAEDDPELVIAELLGVINKMSHSNNILFQYLTTERGNDVRDTD